MPTCYLVGSPHMYNKLGLQREAPPPPFRMLAQKLAPKIPPMYLDERILRVPNVMRMGAQHMQPSPFGAMCLLKAQCTPPNHRRMR